MQNVSRLLDWPHDFPRFGENSRGSGFKSSDTIKPHGRVIVGMPDRHPGPALAVAGAVPAGVASFLSSWRC